MSVVDSVIQRLRSENLCHPNDVAGCEIWTGEFNRAHEPVYGNVKARDYMYQAASGEVIMRGELVNTLCENDACILPAHLTKQDKPTRKPKEPLNEQHVALVEVAYFEDGKRIDNIAEINGWSKPYVTKLVAKARSRRGTAQ